MNKKYLYLTLVLAITLVLTGCFSKNGNSNSSSSSGSSSGNSQANGESTAYQLANLEINNSEGGDLSEEALELVGMTQEEWKAAAATAVYQYNENDAMLEMTFSGLKPDGFYSIWCPKAMGEEEVYEHCGDPMQGSNNVFVAGDGAAILSLELSPLMTKTEKKSQRLELVYYTNQDYETKETGVRELGKLGEDAFIQLSAEIPAASEFNEVLQ